MDLENFCVCLTGSREPWYATARYPSSACRGNPRAVKYRGNIFFCLGHLHSHLTRLQILWRGACAKWPHLLCTSSCGPCDSIDDFDPDTGAFSALNISRVISHDWKYWGGCLRQTATFTWCFTMQTALATLIPPQAHSPRSASLVSSHKSTSTQEGCLR